VQVNRVGSEADHGPDALRNPAHFADAKERLHRTGANAHCYYSLYDARSAAARYLRGLATGLGDGPAPHLERAAELYREIAEDVLRQECVTKVAPMPWMLPEGEEWTQAQREAQARLLERAVALEHEALAEVEAALRAL
jgi:hypothetical protein